MLEVEFGGLNEALANLYRLTGDDGNLVTAERFDHAEVFDPLAARRDHRRTARQHEDPEDDRLHAELAGDRRTALPRHRGEFWGIVTGHHSYAIGGTSTEEYFHAPDGIAGQLTDRTCENCNTYNMLKLTRQLFFHRPRRADRMDFYERALFNQMLASQDPRPHARVQDLLPGLSPGAFKRQPRFGERPGRLLDRLPQLLLRRRHRHGDPGQVRRHHLLPGHSGTLVNLFIPSEVTWAAAGLTIRQDTGFPDEPATHLTVLCGSAA